LSTICIVDSKNKRADCNLCFEGDDEILEEEVIEVEAEDEL
jgi:hypothetical protein